MMMMMMRAANSNVVFAKSAKSAKSGNKPETWSDKALDRLQSSVCRMLTMRNGTLNGT